jgi:hypothetical protein
MDLSVQRIGIRFDLHIAHGFILSNATTIDLRPGAPEHILHAETGLGATADYRLAPA